MKSHLAASAALSLLLSTVAAFPQVAATAAGSAPDLAYEAVPNFFKGQHLETAIQRATFEGLVKQYIYETKDLVLKTIADAKLDSIPLVDRNFLSLANMTPGVTGVGGGGVNTAGQLNRNNSYLVDGVSNDDTIVSSSRGGFSLNPEGCTACAHTLKMRQAS